MSAIGDKQFDNFLATSKSRLMQSSPSILILRIHPHQQTACLATSMLPELAAPQIQIFTNFPCLNLGRRLLSVVVIIILTVLKVF